MQGRHLSILEASFLLTRLPPFFANIGKRMVKAPKLYWNDTGLASHLCGLHSVGALRADSRKPGRLFETLVMIETPEPNLVEGRTQSSGIWCSGVGKKIGKRSGQSRLGGNCLESFNCEHGMVHQCAEDAQCNQ